MGNTVPTPHDPRLNAWRTFLHAHAQVRRQLERELQAEQSMGLGEYELLLILAYSHHRRLRMSELATTLSLSRSGATRLIDRLEAGGLVRRESCDTDRRGQWAALTDDGYARLRGASPTHLRGVAEHFLDLIPPADLDALSRILDRVVERA
ncbi:MAG TPA: MarR family transcriptional regulator [Candidatus Limnocylindria bacterium]|jgi:DNA-binding MarR family transcriptional regulator|nr:MarR family transcriptional regulator [Candidatus Limnocylindria bacterium]